MFCVSLQGPPIGCNAPSLSCTLLNSLHYFVTKSDCTVNLVLVYTKRMQSQKYQRPSRFLTTQIQAHLNLYVISWIYCSANVDFLLDLMERGTEWQNWLTEQSNLRSQRAWLFSSTFGDCHKGSGLLETINSARSAEKLTWVCCLNLSDGGTGRVHTCLKKQESHKLCFVY